MAIADLYCGRDLGDDRRCYGRKLPNLDACLRHASRAERDSFYSGIRTGQINPPVGYLTELTFDEGLFEEIKDLLSSVPSTVDFRHSVFDCTADFTGLRFGHADFTGARFMYSANFRNVIFEGRADFTDVRFGTHGQSFAGARFDDEVTFACSPTATDEVRRTMALHLSAATLAKGARFDGRHFRHQRPGDQFDVNLNDAQAGGNLIFIDVVCDGTIVLDRLIPTAPITVLAPTGSRVSLVELILTEPLTITARVYGQPDAGPAAAPTQLVSLVNATLEAPLTIGDGIALTDCRLIGATGLDHLRVTGVDPMWPVLRHRRVIADELRMWHAPGKQPHGAEPLAPDPRQLESVYRQLRAALEATRAAPAAADFYYGEMEMRRLSCRPRQFEKSLLMIYKLISGYGLRAYRAIATYLVLLLTITALLRYRTDWFVADRTAAAGSAGLAFDQFWDVFAIAARASVNVLSAVTTGLTAAGTMLFILLRLAGPATIALAILALRARVQR